MEIINWDKNSIETKTFQTGGCCCEVLLSLKQHQGEKVPPFSTRRRQNSFSPQTVRLLNSSSALWGSSKVLCRQPRESGRSNFFLRNITIHSHTANEKVIRTCESHFQAAKKKNYSVKRVMNERSNLFVLDLFSQFLNLFLASGQIEHSDLMMRLDKKSEHQQCCYISSWERQECLDQISCQSVQYFIIGWIKVVDWQTDAAAVLSVLDLKAFYLLTVL